MNQNAVSAVSAGLNHSLALLSSGRVVAWGLDDEGQATVPDSAASGVVAIAAGDEHSMALKEDGSVVVWGDDEDGQSTVPDIAGSNVVQIAAGGYHSLALLSNGRVLAWGAWIVPIVLIGASRCSLLGARGCSRTQSCYCHYRSAVGPC
jgi:alpha-tubulin suppressor-like RCC1 family protein